MNDTMKIQIHIPRSLYVKLKTYAVEEGKTLWVLARSERERFISDLVSLTATIETTRLKQKEEAQMVQENPMVVSGHAELLD